MAVTVALPLLLPHVEFVVDVDNESAAGSLTTADVVAVHPLASVTVTL